MSDYLRAAGSAVSGDTALDITDNEWLRGGRKRRHVVKKKRKIRRQKPNISGASVPLIIRG